MLPFMNLRSIEPAGLLPHQRPANGNPYLEHPNEEDAKFEIGHVASQASPKRAYILRHFLCLCYVSVSRRSRCCPAASLASLLRINTKAIATPTASATTISIPNSRILILASIPITAAATCDRFRASGLNDPGPCGSCSITFGGANPLLA